MLLPDWKLTPSDIGAFLAFGPIIVIAWSVALVFAAGSAGLVIAIFASAWSIL